ncbi:MAG: elongation factor P [Bacteriovoracaceae bacterium]|nr:elongation factor P [Bacteriovoracaceae bacterium]
MIPTTDLKKGVKVELDGKPYSIIQSAFTNPGKGSAFYKCRMKNLETGLVIERTFKSGVDTGLMEPDLEEKVMEYMYDDPEGFNFMDQETFESIHLTKDQVGDQGDFLQEGIKFDVLYYNGLPIAIEVPNFVVLKVVETDPGLKGDTAQGGTKKAIMETGLQISVPLFIERDEMLRIDTRTRDYIERAKK